MKAPGGEGTVLKKPEIFLKWKSLNFQISAMESMVEKVHNMSVTLCIQETRWGTKE